jgi:hypothetical protein
MGEPRTDHHPFAAADTPSFLDLLDRVSTDEQLDPRRKADLRSAIKSLGQWLGSDLTAMPAHPRYLRERLASFQPAAAGVSRKRLQNVRSAIAFALDRYGLGGRRSYLTPLSPAAQNFYDRLPDKYFRCRLSRLLHFISAQGIEPEQMTDAVSQAFLAALEQHSAIKHVRTTHQDACRAWNKARAQVAGWPDVVLTVPCYQETYGLPWSDFPASFEAAIDAYFADPIDDGDFFADNGRMKPLSPRTVATQKDHLRCTASALVRSGHDSSDIVDLGYLVRPAHVRQALEFFLSCNGGQPNSYVAAIAYSLRTVAKYGVVLPDADRKEVERLYKKVAQQRHGMTEKNLARLRQLDDPAVRDRLLAFPTLRIREVQRKDSGGVAEALAVQAAVAAELWLFVPLRIANFAGLRLDQHLIRREDRRGARPWAIHVPRRWSRTRWTSTTSCRRRSPGTWSCISTASGRAWWPAPIPGSFPAGPASPSTSRPCATRWCARCCRPRASSCIRTCSGTLPVNCCSTSILVIRGPCSACSATSRFGRRWRPTPVPRPGRRSGATTKWSSACVPRR